MLEYFFTAIDFQTGKILTEESISRTGEEKFRLSGS